MASIDKAAQILEGAERELRELLSRAAGEGDYDSLLQVAACAKRVGELLSELRVASPDVGSDARGAAAVSEPSGGAAAAALSTVPEDSTGKNAVGDRASRRLRRAKTYPEFFRNGDVLVKVAWSKVQNGEYEHKTQFAVVRDFIRALQQTASKRGDFAMGTLLPLKSSADDSEIPSYQTYLCLAWLRTQGLVTQHGRQGYSIRPRTDLLTKAQELFALLPERRFADSLQK